MAPTNRLRYNNKFGTLGADPGTGTTITFTTVPGFPTIADPNYVALTLDPDTATEEIVWLTAFTSGNLTGTISRGQEGTSNVSHPSGTWRHGPTVLDFVQARRASAYLNTASTNLPSGADAIIPLDTINYDPWSNFSTSTHLYTAAVDGYYAMFGRVSLTASVVSMGLGIYRNGTSGTIITRSTASNQSGIQISAIAHLAVNDTVGLYGSASTATAMNTGVHYTALDLHLLST